MAPTTHEVRQRPPVRALALAGVLMVVGLVLMLMATLLDASLPLTVIGLVIIGLGLGLFAVSVWIARTMRVQVRLDEDGYAITARTTSQVGTWADVVRVTRGTDRITLHHKDGGGVQLVVARGRTDDLDALSSDIAARLDASRGYGA
nr:hypothetical protein [Propionicimonas sp.]